LLTAAVAAEAGIDPNPQRRVPGEATTSSVSPAGTGVVLPRSARSTMGNSNNHYGIGRNNQRYQQVHVGVEVGNVDRESTTQTVLGQYLPEKVRIHLPWTP
jgi:hypothetical protein